MPLFPYKHRSFLEQRTVLAEINMTPFVDVCLVLLLIFMVTAPFALSGVNVTIPKAQTKPLSVSQESLVVSITKKGDFYLGKTKIPSAQLTESIRAAITQEKEPLFIRADKGVIYEKVMFAMAAAQRAGIQRIGMMGEQF